ncbi:hypothetical protein NP284_18145 [Rhodopseudomonas pseudopalustris]
MVAATTADATSSSAKEFVSTLSGTDRSRMPIRGMNDDKIDSATRKGNEPAPLLLIAIAVVPLLGIVAWLLGVFG